MILFNKATLLLLLLFASGISAAGLRGAAPHEEPQLLALDDDVVHVPHEEPLLLQPLNDNSTVARELTIVQRRTVLIVRVNDPEVSAAQMKQSVFGHLKQQMERCSQGLVRIAPALPYDVLNVRVGMKLTRQNVNAFVDAAEREALRSLPAGTATNLRDVADHLLFVLPFLKGFSASAEFGVAGRWKPGDEGYTSQYSSKYAPSLSILMHEIGHNLGLHHAGYRSDEYADLTGYLGYSNDQIGKPLMCYNAANHWEMLWYPSARLQLQQAPNVPQRVTVIAFTDYQRRQPNDKVLVRVGNLFMQYNKKKSYNIGTGAFANDLVIVAGGGFNRGRTFLKGGIDKDSAEFVHDAYGSSSDVHIRVCRQYTRRNGVDAMEISIGKYGTNCNPVRTPPTTTTGPAVNNNNNPGQQQRPTSWGWTVWSTGRPGRTPVTSNNNNNPRPWTSTWSTWTTRESRSASTTNHRGPSTTPRSSWTAWSTKSNNAETTEP